MKIFNQAQEEPKINLRLLSQQIDESIGREVNEYYKYLSGKKSTPALDELMVEVEKFKLECQNLAAIDREIANVAESIVKVCLSTYLLVAGRHFLICLHYFTGSQQILRIHRKTYERFQIRIQAKLRSRHL